MKSKTGIIIQNIETLANNLSQYLSDYIEYIEDKYECNDDVDFTENETNDQILDVVKMQLYTMNKMLEYTPKQTLGSYMNEVLKESNFHE